MPGRDEDGNLLPQDPHSILSDVKVRQAIAHSVDYDTIIDNVLLGQGFRMVANVLPTIEWAYNEELEPYAFDLAKAGLLLDEAGWADADGDGVREKDGEPLALTFTTFAGSSTSEDMGLLIEEALTEVGFDINFEVGEFGSVVESLVGETYEMVLIGWGGNRDPNDDMLWHSKSDIPGSGFNNSSYQNAEIDALLEAGISVPGCAESDRAPIYKQIQEILHRDVPFVFIAGNISTLAFSDRWQGIKPGPWGFGYNIEEWSLK